MTQAQIAHRVPGSDVTTTFGKTISRLLPQLPMAADLLDGQTAKVAAQMDISAK